MSMPGTPDRAPRQDLVGLNDPRLAAAVAALVDARVEEHQRRTAAVEEYGTVDAVDTVSRTVSVFLKGSSVASPGYVYPTGEEPVEGDRVRVRRTPDGDQSVVAIFGRDPAAAPGGSGDVSAAWPLGSIFTSTVATDPATLLGFGTWAAFGSGRMLVGYAVGDPDFGTVEGTGGAKTVASAGTNATEATHTHAGPSHTHDLGSHKHALPFVAPSATAMRRIGTAAFGTTAGSGQTAAATITSTSASNTNETLMNSDVPTTNTSGSGGTGNTGAGSSHGHAYTGTPTSVLQPYIVVYFWKRTA